MTQETLTQKIARLKALREARDGTPEQIRARQKARADFEKRVRMQAFDQFIDGAVRYLKANPEAPVQELTAIMQTATRIAKK